MSNRGILGELNGEYLLRFALPGYDALTEPADSRFISFDSRWSEATNIFMYGFREIVQADVTSGLIEIPFPEVTNMPPVVLVQFQRRSDARYCVVHPATGISVTNTKLSLNVYQNTYNSFRGFAYIVLRNVYG